MEKKQSLKYKMFQVNTKFNWVGTNKKKEKASYYLLNTETTANSSLSYL